MHWKQTIVLKRSSDLNCMSYLITKDSHIGYFEAMPRTSPPEPINGMLKVSKN